MHVTAAVGTPQWPQGAHQIDVGQEFGRDVAARRGRRIGRAVSAHRSRQTRNSLGALITQLTLARIPDGYKELERQLEQERAGAAANRLTERPI